MWGRDRKSVKGGWKQSRVDGTSRRENKETTEAKESTIGLGHGYPSLLEHGAGTLHMDELIIRISDNSTTMAATIRVQSETGEH